MSANFFGLFAQAGVLARTNAETAAARSARVAGIVQDGYRQWFEGVTASVGDTARLVQELGKARSPSDLAELQRAWLQAAQVRAAENVKTFVDLSQRLAAEVAVPVAAPVVPAPAASAPVAPAPAAKAEVPVSAPKPAVKAEEKKPAAKAAPKKAATPKAETLRVEAPKAAPKAAPKVEVKPAAAPAPAPATAAQAEAPKAAAPKAEAAKAEAPKADAPKADAKPTVAVAG